MTASENRSLTLTRLVTASPVRVWAAFTQADEVAKWWGPNGYTITTLERDFRVGGVWRFIMHGPDGTEYGNRHAYTEIIENEKIAYVHGSDIDDDPNAFFASVSLAREGDQTRVTMQMTFATAEQRAFVEGFGAVELGYQTLAKLAAHIGNAVPTLDDIPETERFSISRIIDAPAEKVFAAWTMKEHLEKWWGTGGMTFGVEKLDLVPGGVFHYSMKIPNGAVMYGKFTFVEITPPKRLVFFTSFSDAELGVKRHPMSASWPLETVSFLSFEAEGNRTRMTLVGGAWNATAEERQTYVDGFAGMTQGFSSTWDSLAQYLTKG